MNGHTTVDCNCRLRSSTPLIYRQHRMPGLAGRRFYVLCHWTPLLVLLVCFHLVCRPLLLRHRCAFLHLASCIFLLLSSPVTPGVSYIRINLTFWWLPSHLQHEPVPLAFYFSSSPRAFCTLQLHHFPSLPHRTFTLRKLYYSRRIPYTSLVYN